VKLSDPQQAAAERLGQDVCVIAGPGSGKTRVLTERFCWLVREKGTPPDRILAITFTEKATTNIKQRLVNEFAQDPIRRQAIERAYVSTIHGFCTRLLRENAVAAGVDVDFGVLDDTTSTPLVEESAHQALNSLFAEKPKEFRLVLESLYVSNSPLGRQKDLAGALISIYETIRVAGSGLEELDRQPPETILGLTDVVRAVHNLISLPDEWGTDNRRRKRDAMAAWVSEARTVAETPESAWHFRELSDLKIDLAGLTAATRDEGRRIREELLPKVLSHLVTRQFAPLRAQLIEALRRLDRNYREAKTALASLDFSDLEEKALDLLKGYPEVRERIQRKFDYILMDELQDTNPLQWEILNHVRQPDRFFAVGDVNQSIFGFRHADPTLFKSYRASLEGKEIDQLDVNYRSRREILRAVDAVASCSPGVEHRALWAEGEVNATPAPGPVVEFFGAVGGNAEEARDREAHWIGHRIRELEREEPGNLTRFAVLCRKSGPLKRIERALQRAGIASLVIGGRTFYESREVLDLVQALAVLANPLDEISLLGALRSPLVGVRDETLLRLKLAGGLWESVRNLESIDTSAFAPDDLTRLSWFRDRVTELRANRDELPPERMLARLVDESAYENSLDSHGRGNVEKFLARIRELHRERRLPFAELPPLLKALRKSATEAEAPPDEATNAVRLLTIHKSKGLEFPVVFLAGMDQGASNTMDPVCYSAQHGFGGKWRDPSSDKGVGDVIYNEAADDLATKGREEEDRLLYVAMTRAEQRLILSHATAPKSRTSAFVERVKAGFEIGEDTSSRDEVVKLTGTPIRVRFADESPDFDFPPLPGSVDEGDQIADPPHVTAQHDSVIPVTQIGVHAECPRKYYLAHYIGRSPRGLRARRLYDEDPFDPYEEESAGLEAAEVGTQVHHLLAQAAVENPDPEAVRLVERFRSTELARRIGEAGRCETEFDFLMDIGAVLVRGQIDVWFEDGRGLVVADYKTDRFDPERSPDRLRPYELQLRLYAIALERLLGRLPDEALLHFLRHGKTIAVSLDAGALAEARNQVHFLVRAQEEIHFPLNEGDRCGQCGFLANGCPAGGAKDSSILPAGSS
jgi:ATP-dependent exoDNAse (exonuclease V) beta subunit